MLRGTGSPSSARAQRRGRSSSSSPRRPHRTHRRHLGLNADRQETQVSAIVAYLNREEGLPVATNKNLNAETSYEELVGQSLKPKPANAD
jgi:hypothetical protein